ncbi:MAG TPA: hypothetical protein VFP26_09120 [Gemmatimonadaceae bacterium]|jgi:hypothetical protein|nr:hypothetical protein [Gemmatimonadaceae bacterium]
MSNYRLVATALLIAAAATSGCKKNPDPYHIDLADFKSGRQVADTLRYLVGSTEPMVWEAMQRNGFRCAERHNNIVKDGKLALSPHAYLDCYNEHRINFGLRRRVWNVTFPLDSSRTTDVYASYMNQDM